MFCSERIVHILCLPNVHNLVVLLKQAKHVNFNRV